MKYEKRIFTSVSDADMFRKRMIANGFKTTLQVAKNYFAVIVKKDVDIKSNNVIMST